MSKFDFRPYVEQSVLDLFKSGDSLDRRFAEAIESGEFDQADWASGCLDLALLLSISNRAAAQARLLPQEHHDPNLDVVLLRLLDRVHRYEDQIRAMEDAQHKFDTRLRALEERE